MLLAADRITKCVPMAHPSPCFHDLYEAQCQEGVLCTRDMDRSVIGMDPDSEMHGNYQAQELQPAVLSLDIHFQFLRASGAEPPAFQCRPSSFRTWNRTQICSGWLILCAIVLRLVAACPPSCVVCTKDVTLCHQLTYVLAAPVTTRVLIITDGHLSSVDSTNLSLLFNLALLSLSRNGIKEVEEDTLYGLTRLHTLLLGHNHISSSSLPDHTFSKLRHLQLLVLSSNALQTLRGAWFRNTGALTRLQLDGNQITNLTDSSFAGTNLHHLRHLDLSNNFISYIEKDAFRPLPQLQEVDLSRNRLAHMPDVFTPLKQLNLLSLDKNQWSCTCDLHPLAHFLRNYIKSSAHTLRNTMDITCQPSTLSGTTKSVLTLSEANCDSKASNLTLVLKDRRPLLPGQDVALLTMLGFAGAVGLTCLGLVVFNWKLGQGKANEHTSENLCCRTFDESLCAHEARNYHTKGYCNCHLTQENEIKVMSTGGAGKEMPLLQENSHQATLASESTAPDASFRTLKGKDHEVDSALSCLDRRLLESVCSEPPGKKAACNDIGSVTKYCPKSAEKLRSLKHGGDQSQALPQHIMRTTDISSNTFRRRYATPTSALARENLEKHLTNESWQPPIEKEDNGLQPHRQRHFITSSTVKPREGKEHYVQKILYKHRTKYDDSHGLLKWNETRYFQPNNALSCKYVLCDQLQDYMKEIKLNHSKPSKSEEEQIKINRAIEKFLQNEDNTDFSKLSTKIKRVYSPQKANFYDPDLVGKKRLGTSLKTSTHWKQQECHGIQFINLDLKKFSKHGDKNKGKWFTHPQILKKKRIKQPDLKGKTKQQNLRLKLNLYPFRKVRIHPEKSFPEIPRKHNKLVPLKILPTTSEKKPKVNLLSSADFPQQPESNSVKLPSERLLLQHPTRQIPFYQRNGKSAPPLKAKTLSAGNQRSEKDYSYPPGLFPNVDSPTLPQPTPGDAEDNPSHSRFSPESQKGAPQLQVDAPHYSPDTLENARNRISPSPPASGIGAHQARGPTERMTQIEPKASELNHYSLSPRSQTQILGLHKTGTYNEEHILAQNQVLQHKEQNFVHEQLGSQTKSLTTMPKISHPLLDSDIMDHEGNKVGPNLPNTETYDSLLIPWTQSKNNLPFKMTESIPYQNTAELPKEISTPLSGQAIGHLTNSSTKGIDRINTMPRLDGPEDLETKIVEREEENIPHESKTNSSILICTTQMTSKGTTKEKQETQENGRSVKPVLCDSSSVGEAITVKDLSTASSHKTRSGIPSSEIDPDTINNMYDLKEIQNIQPDKDSRAYRDGVMIVETHVN
ncbi:Leucine-rich repeat-containing protein 53 [Fukomys damarensis]|uniref:Leucine-rich repeat-containing protein 53 n=1 Tax=Fukomys damarensis TaxID=885580 RepID=A0A091CYC9_FUKDA|nr:Leucine-rich repeat-containing protein 53 [Fukomys damarensis]